jgi:hypothetical protein
VHPDSATAPKTAEYLPAAQLLHPALPTLTLYLPAAHNKHCSPIFSDPASHTQLTTLWLPAGEVECVGHAVHEDSSAAPTVVEYFPATQSIQVGIDMPTVNDFDSLSPNVEHPEEHPPPGRVDTSSDVIVSCSNPPYVTCRDPPFQPSPQESAGTIV